MYKKKLDDYVEMAPIEKDKLCDLFQLAGIRDQTSLKSI